MRACGNSTTASFMSRRSPQPFLQQLPGSVRTGADRRAKVRAAFHPLQRRAGSLTSIHETVTRLVSWALLVTSAVWMFAVLNSRQMLRDVRFAPTSYCQSHTADFKMVEMIDARCVATRDARRWASNRRVLNTATLLALVLIAWLLAAQTRRREEGTSS